MRVNLVRIGNSQGIRIPKAVLEQCAFGNEADLEIRDGKLVIAPIGIARANWDEAFENAADPSDELLLEDAGGNEFDREDWKW